VGIGRRREGGRRVQEEKKRRWEEVGGVEERVSRAMLSAMFAYHLSDTHKYRQGMLGTCLIAHCWLAARNISCVWASNQRVNWVVARKVRSPLSNSAPSPFRTHTGLGLLDTALNSNTHCNTHSTATAKPHH